MFRNQTARNSAAHCFSSDKDLEGTPLLAGRRAGLHCNWLTQLAKRCAGTSKCVSSKLKAALLILLWTFVLYSATALMPKSFAFMASLFITNNSRALVLVSYFIGVLSNIVSFSFYPLAGFLADVKYGHFKTIFVSLCFILISQVLFLLIVGPLVTAVIASPSSVSLCL